MEAKGNVVLVNELGETLNTEHLFWNEITGKIFTGGISGIYGFNPENMRLRVFGSIKPFNRFGGEVYGSIGTVKDTRDDTDFHFGSY